MALLFNHIQGKNGSRWTNFIKQTGVENILILAVDAAKYTHKVMICTYFGEILVSPFDIDASRTGFDQVTKVVEREKEKHQIKEVVVGIETTGHRSEEHTSELQSRGHLVCRLLLEKKKERKK